MTKRLTLEECYAKGTQKEGEYDPERALGIDYDDVVRATYAKIVEIRNRGLPEPEHLTLEDVKHWHLDQVFGEKDFGIRMFDEHNEEISLESSPIEGACETIRRLRAKGFHIVIVTSLFDHSVELGKRWLKNHGVEYDALIVTREKSKHFKGLCHLDDGPHNLEPFLRLENGTTTPVCFHRPWNEGKWEGHRVRSWKEFEEWVDRHHARVAFPTPTVQRSGLLSEEVVEKEEEAQDKERV